MKVLWFVTCFVYLICGFAYGQENFRPKEFSDFVESQVAEQHIPGAVLVVVIDDHIEVARGFGFANVHRKKKVSPENTLFRVGSISKLFTATAILQLKEKGLLDLNQDISAYVSDFTIPRNYPGPVTLKNLLTHTSGFDNTDIRDAARTMEEALPLSRFLRFHFPAQVFPPGKIHHYSNHAYALAGLIVEGVSGRPFAEAIDSQIFAPLEMKHSSFAQPIPADLRQDLAVSYEYVDNKFSPLPLDFSNVVPADALVTTGTDMARFLLAQLNSGASSNERILSKEAIQEMQSIHYTAHPQLPGIAYAFFEEKEKGYRLLTHTGGQLGFVTQVVLFPEKKIAYFLSYNRRASGLRRDVYKKFWQLFSARGEVSQDAHTSLRIDRKYTGYYQFTDRSLSTLEKVWLLIGIFPELKIKIDGDSLLIDKKRYRSAGEGLVVDDSGNHVAFSQPYDGKMFLFEGLTPYERVPWYRAVNFHRTLIVLCLLLYLSSFFLLKQKRERKAVTVAVASSILLLIFALAVALTLKTASRDFDYGIPFWVRLVLCIPWIAVLPTLLSLLYVRLLWQKKMMGLVARIHYTAVAFSSAIFLMLLRYWNLL